MFRVVERKVSFFLFGSKRMKNLFDRLFKKETHLVTDGDFDSRYKIVVIKGFNDTTPYIYELDDDSYTRVLFEFPNDYTKNDVKIYKFSTGVKKLCVKKLLPLLFDNEYDYNRNDFIAYLKNAGCSDIVMDAFISCTASDINNDYMPKSRYVRVYDYDGKFLSKRWLP